MRVLALVKYGSQAASTRQRFMQFESALAEAGIEVDYSPLLGNDHMGRLVRGDRPSPTSTAAGYLRRVRALLGARRYDILWIYSETFPYLPGLFERLPSLVGKPIVYDIDDAIFHMYGGEAASPLVRRLLNRKLEPLLRTASACCCGNAYLQKYAARFCSDSIVVPTVVDTEIYKPRQTGTNDPLVIGWIGSPSTWCNVEPILPLLVEVALERGVKVRAIGAGHKAAGVSFPGLESVDWCEETEVDEVRKMDIGIMPLLDLPFQRGKSGYKLIQYMACGLPVIASPIGVNSEIVEPGANGLLATNPEEWRKGLHRLIDDARLRRRMGAAGRERAVARYSLATQAPRLIELFRTLGTDARESTR